MLLDRSGKCSWSVSPRKKKTGWDRFFSFPKGKTELLEFFKCSQVATEEFSASRQTNWVKWKAWRWSAGVKIVSRCDWSEPCPETGKTRPSLTLKKFKFKGRCWLLWREQRKQHLWSIWTLPTFSWKQGNPVTQCNADRHWHPLTSTQWL